MVTSVTMFRGDEARASVNTSVQWSLVPNGRHSNTSNRVNVIPPTFTTKRVI